MTSIAQNRENDQREISATLDKFYAELLFTGQADKKAICPGWRAYRKGRKKEPNQWSSRSKS